MADEDVLALLFLLTILVGIPWAVWNYDLNPLSDEVSVYPQKYQCDENKKCDWVNFPYTTYKVNFDMSTVTSWNSKKPWPLGKSSNCNIRDKKNWSCGNIYSSYGFNDGQYSAKSTKELRYTSKSMWWFYNFVGETLKE